MTHHATPWIIGYTVVQMYMTEQRSFEEDVLRGTGVLHVFFVVLLKRFAGIMKQESDSDKKMKIQ